jgi:murein DD-endopeptidase MepM/ murein hydrolase activator NlpD
MTARMTAPFKGKFKVTSPRGYRNLGGREYHGGMDLVGLDDKTVYAIADGVVDAVPYEKNGFGYYVRQLLPDGRRIYYGHLAKGSAVVKAGQQIKVGDKLGTMGSTGRSTGTHTHIELRVKGTSKTSLDISEFTGIPNRVGTYENELTKHEKAEASAELIKSKCGLSDETIKYLKEYKFADDLLIKISEKLK